MADSVELAERLMAHLGDELVALVAGIGVVEGELLDAAASWCAIGGSRTWYVRHSSLVWMRGLSDRSAPRASWPRLAQLSFASPLRHLADAREAVVVHGRDGTLINGGITRIGRDFVELRDARGSVVVPLDYVASVSKGGRSPSTS